QPDRLPAGAAQGRVPPDAAGRDPQAGGQGHVPVGPAARGEPRGRRGGEEVPEAGREGIVARQRSLGTEDGSPEPSPCKRDGSGEPSYSSGPHRRTVPQTRPVRRITPRC